MHWPFFSNRKRHAAGSLFTLLIFGVVLWTRVGQSAALPQPADLHLLEQSATNEDGPGLSDIFFQEDELFSVISRINKENGAPLSHGAVSMHNGYLVIIYAVGGGRHQGGFSFYDISDPYSPRYVAGREDEETYELREAHAYGYSSSYGGEFEGRDLVVLQARRGIQIWDWTNVHNPVRVSYLQMPGISGGDYTHANWWTFWQAPYVYVGGTDSGIYVIDASDPREPFLADRGDRTNPIPNGETGGFRIGSLYAVGNLMVVAGNDVPGYATLDISDPVHPTLIASTTSGPENYSVLVNGNRIYGAARFKELYTHDISDPANIEQVAYFKGTNDKGGYLSYQDGFIHIGASVNYMKIDVRDDGNHREVGRATTGIVDGDQDFVTVLGNMIVLGDDHNYGSFLIPHESEPDNLGPTVNMVSPPDAALNQLTTSRVGLTFSDLIDLRTVNTDTVQIRPVDGNVLRGYYSGQTGVINFTPLQPLQSDVVYEIYVPANGVRDVSGNATRSDFRSYFSTGSALSAPPTCSIVPAPPLEAGVTATFTATMLSGIGPVTYQWDFGDGNFSEPSSNWTVTHTYETVGHYTLRVTIANGDGSGNCVTQITVHHPLTADAPQRSSTILMDRSGETLWNVNPDNDTVTAINATNLVKRFEQPAGRGPRALAQAPDQTIWVVNQKEASISILNSVDGSLMRTIHLPHGSQPYGILFHEPSANIDEAAAYVSLQGSGKVIRLGVLSRSTTAELDVGPFARGLALSADGSRLFVARFISPAHRGEVTEIDTTDFAVVRVHALGMDPGPDTESSGRGVPNGLGQIAISPDGRRLWVPAKKDNTQRGLLTDGRLHGFDSTVRTIAAQIDLVDNFENPAERHDFENSDLASAVDFTPLGDYAFVTLQGSNAVAVLDTQSRLMVTRLHEVGRAPVGLVLNAAGTRLYVHSYLSRSVFAYDVPELLAGNVSARLPLAKVKTVAQEKLPASTLEGKRIFYNSEDARMNKDGYLSCASCHLDGDQDGRTWDRNGTGEGSRNTTSLLGHGGMAQGRIHWSANFDEIQDFEHDMRAHFGGLGFLSDALFNEGTRSHPLGDRKAGQSEELDALADYVASLTEVPDSPHRNPDGTLTDAGVAGKRIFEGLNCGSCHGGVHFTDSVNGLLHDIGTMQSNSGKRLDQPLFGLDTPTLRGLWQSAPYLHNGGAATLESLLTGTNINGLHGEAATLSVSERAQLIAYLLQLDSNESGAPLPAPAVRIEYPADGEYFAPGESLTIRAELPAPLRPVNRVEFSANGDLIGRVDESPYHLPWRVPTEPVDLYLVAAKAFYSGNEGTVHDIRLKIDVAVATRTPTATPLPSTTPAVTSPTATPNSTATKTPASTPAATASSTPTGTEEQYELLFLPLMAAE